MRTCDKNHACRLISGLLNASPLGKKMKKDTVSSNMSVYHVIVISTVIEFAIVLFH